MHFTAAPNIALQCHTCGIAKTISITLPPDLLLKAQQTAKREHRTMSELLREALRRYMTDDPPRSSQDGTS